MEANAMQELAKYAVFLFNPGGGALVTKKDREFCTLSRVTGEWIPAPMATQSSLIDGITTGTVKLVETSDKIESIALALASLKEIDLLNRLLLVL